MLSVPLSKCFFVFGLGELHVCSVLALLYSSLFLFYSGNHFARGSNAGGFASRVCFC